MLEKGTERRGRLVTSRVDCLHQEVEETEAEPMVVAVFPGRAPVAGDSSSTARWFRPD